MRIREGDVAGVNALVDVVARFGTVNGVDEDVVTIELVGTSYQFFVYERVENGTGRPMAMLVAASFRTAGQPFTTAFDVPGDGSFVIEGDTAVRLFTARARFGQCQPCATYHHHLCHAQTERGGCRCECAAEWAATRAAAAAMELIRAAPVVREPGPWVGPCLCACQQGGTCDGCGHARCQATAVVEMPASLRVQLSA